MEYSREYHYVYYSYEEWGKGYFGSRTCKCPPEEDVKYFGSFSDKTFNPTQKIILKSDYATREDAYSDEVILHDYYEVAKNPHFANRAKQTSTSFTRQGLPCSKEQKETLRKKLKGKHCGENNPMYGRRGKLSPSYGKKGKNSPNFGSTRSEETRRRMSESSKGRVFSEEHRRKISEAKKNPSEETKRKLSEVKKKVSLFLKSISKNCLKPEEVESSPKSIGENCPKPGKSEDFGLNLYKLQIGFIGSLVATLLCLRIL